MKNENNDFNSWSFLSGMIVGMVIRSTDMLPLFSGFLLGMSIARIPEMIIIEQFPSYLQFYAYKLKNALMSEKNNNNNNTNTNTNLEDNNNKTDKIKIKPKK